MLGVVISMICGLSAVCSEGIEMEVFRSTGPDSAGKGGVTPIVSGSGEEETKHAQRMAVVDRVKEERKVERQLRNKYEPFYDLLVSVREETAWGTPETVSLYNNLVHQLWLTAACLGVQKKPNDPVLCRQISVEGEEEMSAAEYVWSNRHVWESLLGVLNKLECWGTTKGNDDLEKAIEGSVSSLLRKNLSFASLINQNNRVEYPENLARVLAAIHYHSQLWMFDKKAALVFQNGSQQYINFARPVLSKAFCLLPYVSKDRVFYHVMNSVQEMLCDVPEEVKKDITKEEGFLQALRALEWVCGPGKQQFTSTLLWQFEDKDEICSGVLDCMSAFAGRILTSLRGEVKPSDAYFWSAFQEIRDFSIPEASDFVRIVQWLELPESVILTYCVHYARDLGQSLSGRVINIGARGGDGLVCKFLESGKFKQECFEMLVDGAPDELVEYLAYLEAKRARGNCKTPTFCKKGQKISSADQITMDDMVAFLSAIVKREGWDGLQHPTYQGVVSEFMAILWCIRPGDQCLHKLFALGGNHPAFAKAIYSGGADFFERYIVYLEERQEKYDAVVLIQFFERKSYSDVWRSPFQRLVGKLTDEEKRQNAQLIGSVTFDEY